MGRLQYDRQSGHVDLDDRTLAHLQIAVGAKLRRGESFFFSWNNDVSVGSGRNSVWIHPLLPLEFHYSGNRPPRINTEWVESLMRSANTPGGLRIVPEPDDIDRAAAGTSPGARA